MGEIRYRSSVVVVHNHKLLGFNAVDPFNQAKYFFLPGGKIEENETAEQAAVRETFEETGYRIQLSADSKIESEYDFYWNGQLYLCHTIYFAATLLSEEKSHVNDATYNTGIAWLELENVDEAFSYSQPILKVVKSLIE